MNAKKLQESIILENSRVKLIPFESKRKEELRNIIFEDSIWTFMGHYIRTKQDFESYIKNTIEQKKKGICYPFLIIDKLTDEVAGSTRYGYLNLTSQKCEIGWTWYGIKFQGTGLNKACKYELLNFGFNEIGFRRIQFSADLENVRSQRAIEKLGAQKEGVFRNNYIDSTGKSKTDVYFSLIKEEWNEISSKHFSEYY